MPRLTASEQVLFAAVVGGNSTKVGKLLKKKEGESASSVASGGGTDRIESATVLLAALHGHVGIIKLLVGRGVDLSASFASSSEFLRTHMKDSNWSIILSTIPKGLGLVSAAVIGRRIPALQCVLRAGADPNTPDGVGCNALQVPCFDGDDERRLCIVRELLKWGANPDLRGSPYGSALHTAAEEGHTNLFTTLLAAAPATLNLVDEQGLTPLGTATSFGQHKAVTCLLSLGASDRQVFQETRSGSLQEAVVAGHDTLLSLLLSGKGLEAVGGLYSIPDAMGCAVTKSRTRTLNLLLSVEGEERREFWARTRVSDDYSGKCMLHFAAEFTSLSAVKLLLAAGANEAAVDINGALPRDVIGTAQPAFGPPNERDPTKEAAIARVLKCGPAFRARSWAWPARLFSEPRAGYNSAMMIPSSKLKVCAVSVLLTRPRSRVFTTRFARYAEK